MQRSTQSGLEKILKHPAAPTKGEIANIATEVVGATLDRIPYVAIDILGNTLQTVAAGYLSAVKYALRLTERLNKNVPNSLLYQIASAAVQVATAGSALVYGTIATAAALDGQIEAAALYGSAAGMNGWLTYEQTTTLKRITRTDSALGPYRKILNRIGQLKNPF